MTEKQSVYIIGAGPAGLAAAIELSRKREFNVNVIENRSVVGGISRTEFYKGYLFDIGGHRFYTKSAEVDRMWRDTLGDEFLRVRRLSRIYYKKQYYNYPLQLSNTIRNLGIPESVLICFSYLKACLLPELPESTFEQWVSNRFGKRLYRMFFKDYTEKVWGIPCNMIEAEWAAQRIQGLSFLSAMKSAVFGISSAKSLIEEFRYPRLGPGMMWQAFQKKIVHQGGCFQLGSKVTSLQHENSRITAVTYNNGRENIRKDVDTVISSTPLSSLVHLLTPQPPKHILDAADKLSYRSFIIVILIVRKKSVFSDQWLYVHSPEILAGRIQNFKNWSQSMVPDKNTTSLGIEYFCDENDLLWNQTNEQLVATASREIEQLGFAKEDEIIDSHVVRQSKAYPVYDRAIQAIYWGDQKLSPIIY